MLNSPLANSPQRGSYFVIYELGTPLALIVLAIIIAVTPLTWLLLLLTATAAILLALVFPWLGWLGLAFALPIASGLRIGPASATDLLFAAALGLWCASVISQRKAFHAPKVPIWSVAIYCLVLYLSAIGAPDLDEALTEMVKWIEFGALLVIMPMAIPSRHVPWLVALLLAAASVQGLYGLYQFIYRIGPDWFLIQGRYMRASGVFGQPNPFGGYLGLSLPVAFSLSLWGLATFFRKRSLATLLWTLFYLAATICITVGIVASWSRGAWLGVVGGGIVVLAFFDRRTSLLLGMAALVLLAAALVGALNPNWVPTAISGRIGDIPTYLGFVNVLQLEVNDDNFAVIERVAHWVAALRMWELSPWLGVGPGNYATVYPSVALPLWSDPLGHAHNIYLNVLGETGLVGLSAFLLMWASLGQWLFQNIRTVLPQKSWSHALAVGVLGVLAHLAIHSFFDNLFVQGIYLQVAFLLAAVAAMAYVPNELNRTSSVPFQNVPSESDG